MRGDAFADVFYAASDGLRLHARVYGELGHALPVVCLPGLTRNARDFHEVAIHLSAEARRPRPVIAFDYRGRGQSARDPDWTNYHPAVEAGDVITGLVALDLENAVFIGTSRGGLIIQVLAGMRPGLIAGAVLNDIGPVVDGAGLAQIRAVLDRAPKHKGFDEAITYLRAANGVSFSALGDADWERMAHAMFRDDAGRPVPDFDPALANIMKAVDLNRPVPDTWHQFEGLLRVPVLAIRGENSRLLSEATLQEMARRHPELETVTVEGQGHAPLLETGDLPRRIARFLEKVEKRRR